MTNEANTLSEEKTIDTSPLQISHSSSIKEALVITLPVEKRLPAPLKEIPISKWIMPPVQQGYIQGNDNDCL